MKMLSFKYNIYFIIGFYTQVTAFAWVPVEWQTGVVMGKSGDILYIAISLFWYPNTSLTIFSKDGVR